MEYTDEQAQQYTRYIDEWREDPQFFAIAQFGIENQLRPKQLEFAEKFRDNRRITFKGGVGFGKTRGLAVMVWWSLICHNEVKVTIFAPTEATLRTGLATEIKSLYDKMDPFWQQAFTVTAEKIERTKNGADCVAYFRTVNKDNPSANAGIHATNNFIICDEATGIDEIVYTQALLGHLDTDRNPKIALIANPRTTSGFFWRTWNDDKISSQWTKVHGKMTDNPFVTQANLDAKAQEFGILSNEYRFQVLGEFPLADENSLIASVLIEQAIDNELAIPSEKRPIFWGVDPAGPGKDSTVLLKRHDNIVMDDIKQWRGLNITQLSYEIRDLYQATPKHLKPAVIAVDANGLGRGLFDNLLDWGLPVKGITTQSSPTRGEGKGANGGGMYSRLRDQLWWEVKEWFQTENVRIPRNRPLVEELKVPSYKYEASNGRIKVDSKDIMKKRLSGRSPDYADALCLTFAVSTSRYSSAFSWSKPIDYGNTSWMS